MKSAHKYTVAALIIAISNSSYAAEINTGESESKFGDVKFKFTTGVDYSEGDYGQSKDTKITYVPFTAKATIDDFALKLTVPWLQIEGPGAVVGGGGSGVVSNRAGAVTTESGMGDVVVAGIYSYDITDETYLDFTGKIKLPTANENKGLGTGEIDYTLAIDFTHEINDVSLYTGGGRRFVGTNASLRLEDVWFGSVGLGYNVNHDLNVGVSYDFSEAAGSGDAPSDATLYGSYKLTDTINLQPYAVKGFSDGSADFGGGLMIGYKL